jgi:hypothetical protein
MMASQAAAAWAPSELAAGHVAKKKVQLFYLSMMNKTTQGPERNNWHLMLQL